MLNQIPGVNIVFESGATTERRGLRANQEQILINGKQISAKENDAGAALQRISASQVERIELIRGNVAEVDGNTGRVLNVIFKDDAQSLYSYFAGWVGYRDGTWRPSGNATYAYTSPNLNYSIGLRSDLSYRPWQRLEQISEPDGTPRRDIFDTEQYLSQFYRVSGSLDYRLPGERELQVNALIQHRDIDREKREFVSNPSNPTPFQSDILEDDRRNRETGEISVDYEFPLGRNGRFTAVGFFNIEAEDKARDVYDLIPLDEPILLFETRDDLKTETIARGTYDRSLSEGQSLEVGLEVAFNTQDTKFEVFVRDGADFTALDIFNSDSLIEELRAEPFVTYSVAAGKWQFEAGLTVEASELKQSGPDVSAKRTLTYAKPKLNAWFTATEQSKFWAFVERDITQLNFLEFIATIQADERELEAGNPDLLPEKSWDLEAGWEQRFFGDGGLLSVRGFYRDVSDVSETISFDGIISQPGNIGSGRELGFDADGSIRLESLGLVDGVINASYLRRSTRVTDPFTGERRPFAFTPRYEFNASYRQELGFVPASASISFRKTGRQFDFDLDETTTFVEEPNIDLVLDYRFSDKVSMYLTLGNALNRETTTDRTGYLLNAIDGRIGRFERETQTWGRYWLATLKGTF